MHRAQAVEGSKYRLHDRLGLAWNPDQCLKGNWARIEWISEPIADKWPTDQSC